MAAKTLISGTQSNRSSTHIPNGAYLKDSTATVLLKRSLPPLASFPQESLKYLACDTRILLLRTRCVYQNSSKTTATIYSCK